MQPPYAFAEWVWMTDVITLCPCHQQHFVAGAIDSRTRGADAFDRGGKFVKRDGRCSSGVLNRETGDARGHTQPYSREHVLRASPEPGHGVGAYGQIDRRGDIADVRETSVPRDGVVII